MQDGTREIENMQGPVRTHILYNELPFTKPARSRLQGPLAALTKRCQEK